MTLRASQRMMRAAEAITGTVQRNLGKRAACERHARAKAKASADTTRMIGEADLPRSAALGALDAVMTQLIATDGPTRAKTAILAAIGRRG